ncbi:hypothetical protein BDW72DRAFT_193306 [Aspergillus terricola var. indicus]
MTCGFFVICLPCVLKIIKESGVAGQLKKLTKGSRRNYASTYNSHEPSSRSHASGQRAEYNELDEDAVQMNPLSLEASKSTERLHRDGEEDPAGVGLAITKTTQLAMTEGKGTFSTKYMYP